ncbi:MAG: hypothetical protein OEQ53_19815, partial [Saprospiraceae bacterium]|nr:hypothetical protein [Saprospiraceae bacterium]
MIQTPVACVLLCCLFVLSCGNRHNVASNIPFDLRVAYNVLDNEDSLNYEVYWMDLDGGNVANLTQSTSVDWCIHAYDDKIYFLSDRDTSQGFYHLFEMIPSTRKVRKLFNECVVDSWIGSRKGGTEFVICVERHRKRAFLIIDSVGSVLNEVFETDEYSISDPFFSPGGQYIVYRSDKSGRNELWKMDVLGIEEKQLTDLGDKDTVGSRYYRAGPPCWVSDSNFISFTSRRKESYDIMAVSPDGNDLDLITSTEDFNEGWHTWSPHADWIVFDGASSDA